MSRPVSLLTVLWLACLSASAALATTVLFLDRTTLSGVSRPWATFLALSFGIILAWWLRPGIAQRQLSLARYEPVALLCMTAPLIVASLALVAASYLSEEAHNYLFMHFYCRRLLSDRSWPVGLLAAAAICYAVAWTMREALLELGAGRPMPEATGVALARLHSLLLMGVASIGLLLATASLSMINVNFWRYWATADGWVVVGHYPSTFTDPLHVANGVSRFFVSFPLLPAMLLASYNTLGHNTLGAYAPLIVGSTLLPLAVFLTVKEVTKDPVVAFLSSIATGSFPLLRSYTMDVGEADGLLMTAVLFAAYFRLRADRSNSSTGMQILAGLSAAVASLARPEGILYVAAMYLADLRSQWQTRRFWISIAAFATVVVGFSMVCIKEFGMAWPSNHSGTLRPQNFVSTLQAVQQSGLFRQYASALGLSEAALAALTIGMLAWIGFSSLQMLRNDFALIYMPATALGNVAMVFLVGPVPAEATKFHDFFRHISYGFPLLAVTMAYGADRLFKYRQNGWSLALRLAFIAAFGMLVLSELSLLAGPVTPGSSPGTPIMTSDVHVMATELVIDPYPLPVMKFRQSESRYVPDADQYMAVFPDDLNRHYAASDVRLVGNAVDYYDAAKLLFLGFLALGCLSVYQSKGEEKQSCDSRQ